MLNVKNCFFSYPKTWKKATEYDLHMYKEDRLLTTDASGNVTLIDNLKSFEDDIEVYKKDLIEGYKLEDHISRKKTDKEINKIFYSSKIMRSFRVSVNHIELNSLHNEWDNEEQRKQNIVNFYKDNLATIENYLNENLAKSIKDQNLKNQKIKIVLADLHFDQTSPHMHIHISSFYKRYSKKHKREVLTCNINKTDLIGQLIQEKKQEKLNCTINELLTQKVKEYSKQKNLKQLNLDLKVDQLDLINKVNLKKLFPEIYDVQLYKMKHNLQKLAINENGTKLNRAKQHRLDKELVFKMDQENLSKLNLEVSKNNDIDNRKKMDDVTLYCWKQSLALQTIKEQQILYYQSGDWTKKFIPDLSKVNDNKYIKNMIDRSTEDELLKIDVIQPIDLKKKKLVSNLSEYCPELKNIENELTKSLKLDNSLSPDQSAIKISNSFNLMEEVKCNVTKVKTEENKKPELLESQEAKEAKVYKKEHKFSYDSNTTNQKPLLTYFEDFDLNHYFMRQRKVKDLATEERLKELRL